MSGNSAFVMSGERGWRRGFDNMLNNEFSRWWKTREWWVQALIWITIIGFMLGAVLFSGTGEAVDGYMIYSIFAGIFPAVAVIITMQDAVVGEKQTGTAAWVLSKPVSRQAFILSKIAANSVGVLVTMVLLPGIVAYILLSIASGHALNPLGFLAGFGVIWLVLLFFLTFTVMLGTLFSQRGPVIGLALALLFFQQYLTGMLPALKNFLPWSLVVPANDLNDAMLPNLLQGKPVDSFLPLAILAVEIIIFVLVSLWRFQREEF